MVVTFPAKGTGRRNVVKSESDPNKHSDYFVFLNKMTMQQINAMISSNFHNVDNEIHSGIPNFIRERVIPITGTIIPR